MPKRDEQTPGTGWSVAGGAAGAASGALLKNPFAPQVASLSTGLAGATGGLSLLGLPAAAGIEAISSYFTKKKAMDDHLESNAKWEQAVPNVYAGANLNPQDRMATPMNIPMMAFGGSLGGPTAHVIPAENRSKLVNMAMLAGMPLGEVMKPAFPGQPGLVPGNGHPKADDKITTLPGSPEPVAISSRETVVRNNWFRSLASRLGMSPENLGSILYPNAETGVAGMKTGGPNKADPPDSKAKPVDKPVLNNPGYEFNPMRLTPKDLDLLVRTTIGEAYGQSMDGDKVAPLAAVASVIMNRAKRSGMPVSDVVLANKQFEPWANRVDELASIPVSSEKYQSTLKALVPYLSGQIPSPVGESTHFYAPKLQAGLGRNDPSWLASATDSTLVDGHNFYTLKDGYSVSRDYAGNRDNFHDVVIPEPLTELPPELVGEGTLARFDKDPNAQTPPLRDKVTVTAAELDAALDTQGTEKYDERLNLTPHTAVSESTGTALRPGLSMSLPVGQNPAIKGLFGKGTRTGPDPVNIQKVKPFSRGGNNISNPGIDLSRYANGQWITDYLNGDRGSNFSLLGSDTQNGDSGEPILKYEESDALKRLRTANNRNTALQAGLAGAAGGLSLLMPKPAEIRFNPIASPVIKDDYEAQKAEFDSNRANARATLVDSMRGRQAGLETSIAASFKDQDSRLAFASAIEAERNKTRATNAQLQSMTDRFNSQSQQQTDAANAQANTLYRTALGQSLSSSLSGIGAAFGQGMKNEALLSNKDKEHFLQLMMILNRAGSGGISLEELVNQ